jgi:alpha-mannosidase
MLAIMRRPIAIGILALMLAGHVCAQDKSHTCLGIVSSNLAKGPDNFYGYYRFSDKKLLFKKGDVLVYDIFLDPKSPILKGGIDIDLSGALAMREHDFVDQNGIPAHGDGILTPAAGKWYTRRIALNTLSGLEAVSWNLVFEGDADGQYAQFVDDVHIERADGSRTNIYEGGMPHLHEVAFTNGYSNQPLIADVPRADVRAGNASAAVAEVEQIGGRFNELTDLNRGTELVHAALAANGSQTGLNAALANAEAATHAPQPEFDRALATLKREFQKVSPIIKSYTGDMVGYAHTDIEWLWEWPEARQAVYVTWRQALKFMDEYPDFTFSQSTSGYYQAMEDSYPDLFKQVQKRVREGRWELLGGRICEADENLLSPEAHAMHFLYGQRYFRERFGKIATVGWEPDTFGHTAQMPQILKLGGCDSYYFCRAGKNEPLFWWTALDGTKILTFDQTAAGAWYNGPLDDDTPKLLIPWQKKTDLKEMLWVYGVGNHGGGPTKENIQTGQKFQKAAYEPSAKFTTATAFFKDVRAKDLSHIPALQTELNPVFDGCYTSQARMKLLNDQAEAATTSAEAVCAAASTFGFKYPRADFRKSWETIGFNQHHDTICGSAFHWAYLKTIPELTEVVAKDKTIDRLALEHLVSHITAHSDGQTLLVFNPLGWARGGYTDTYLPRSLFGGKQPDISSYIAVGPNGETAPIQVLDEVTGAARFYAPSVPAFGFAVYALKPGVQPKAPITEIPSGFDNGKIRVVFDTQAGCISHIFDAKSGRDLAGGIGLGRLESHLEAPNPDAWDLNKIVSVASVPVAKIGHSLDPFAGKYVFDYELKDPQGKISKIRQTFSLGAGSDHIDVRIDCEWHAMGNTGLPSPLLRAAFNLGGKAPDFTYQVPFGAIQRPADGIEMPAQSWADVSSQDVGVTIVEEGKHGFSGKDGTVRMSLIRSYDHPDFEGNLGEQHWDYQIVPHSGEASLADATRRASELAQPLLPIMVPPDSKGDAPDSWSAVTIDRSSVVPTALKLAEDDQDLVVRAFESSGRQASVRVAAYRPIGAAVAVNFLEDPLQRLTPERGGLSVPFGPFQIQTLKLKIVRSPDSSP